MNWFKKLLLAFSVGAVSFAAAAEDQVWTNMPESRFAREINLTRCVDWNHKGDYKILFPETDLSCVKPFLKTLAQRNAFEVPRATRRGGFKANFMYGDWELVGYSEFWKGDIDDSVWNKELAAFSSLIVGEDSTLTWAGQKGEIKPSLSYWGLYRNIRYHAHKRRKNLPDFQPAGSTERIVLSPCTQLVKTCLIVTGVQILVDGSQMNGRLVYRKKTNTSP